MNTIPAKYIALAVLVLIPYVLFLNANWWRINTMKKLIAVLTLIVLALVSHTVLAAPVNTAEQAITLCVGQGEYASTTQLNRQKHDKLTLEIALEIVEGEFHGPVTQRKAILATTEYVFSYGRWANPEDISNAVIAYCIRGINEYIKERK